MYGNCSNAVCVSATAAGAETAACTLWPVTIIAFACGRWSNQEAHDASNHNRCLLSSCSCTLSCSDNAGATPLMLAVEANSPSCIKWLLERGADPKVHLKTGWQALHLALRLGHDSCVLMLLQEVRCVMACIDVV